MIIPDELLHAAKLTETELRIEIAVMLFQQDRLTLGQAATFANLRQLDMQGILAKRQIPLHYGIEELEQDLAFVEKRLRS